MKRLFLRLSFAAALACGASAAASTFSVTGSGNKFVVMRDDASAAETVRYRTVALSAYPGQHFTEKSGTLAFAAGQKAVTNTVTESTPSAAAYKFQSGTQRSYRFEVTDIGGFPITNAVRAFSAGTSVSTSYLNREVTDLVYFTSGGSLASGSGNKYLDVSLSGNSSYRQVTDGGYKQAVHTVGTGSLFGNNADLRTFLDGVGCKMYATVYFTQKEEQDGYQYIQILADNATTYDGNDPNGAVDAPSVSIYKACFILSYDPSGSVMEDDHYQFFPHRYDYADKAAETSAGIGHHEFDYDNSHLYGQKFRNNTPSYRTSTSGSLVLPTSVNNLNIRFDAAGSGGDTWDFKNLKVRLAIVDTAAPVKIAASAAPGVRSRGNELYVSVALNEPVAVSDTPTLTTSWGTLSYTSGSGSNVLTFKGKISDAASGSLDIASWSGTIKDLAGNALAGSSALNETDLATLDASHAYTISCDLAGGSASNPTTYTYDSAAITLANPTRPGYDFDGWSGTGFSGLANAVTIPARSHGDRAYTAHWTPVTYTVHFDPNGGTGTPMPDQTFTYDVATNLAANAFARTGYTFDGWDYAGTTYPDGAAVQNLTNENATVTLSAHWTPVAYAITYANATNGVDGVVNANPTSYTIEDGTVHLANPTRTNYFFCGWYGNPDSTGDPVSSFSAADLGERTFYAKWIPVPWNGSGTGADPYIISTREELDAIAEYANAGIGDSRVAYYRLDADIAYDSAVTNSYTPIGNAFFSFTGTFDGNGHTISGISISRPDSNYQGLFGFLSGATVRNLTLADSVIEGQSFIGGIAGYSNRSSIQNCFVTRTTLSDGGNIGAIAGNCKYGALSGNAYRGCTINGSAACWGIGNDSDNLTRVWPCYALALAEKVVTHAVPQFSFPVYGTNNSYYAVGQSVTVRAAAGYALANVRVNGSDATDNGNGTFSFAMPAADATVTADVEALPAIPYIDAGGEPQACTNYTVIAGAAAGVTYGESGAEAWCVVTNDVTIGGRLYFSGTAHLILCDGATLTVTNGNGNAIDAIDLTIYGQAGGTGAIVATGGDDGIYGGHLTLNGGSVTATGDIGISAMNSVTINGGIVAATGGSGIGIYGGNVTINGGTVAATGGNSGIGAGIITLGWTNPDDSIYASGYYSPLYPVTVNGTLTDGDIAYSGSIDVSDIAGKTLRPPMPAISYLDEDGVERQRYLYTVLTSADTDVAYGTAGAENWYAVTNDVAIGGNLLFDGTTHLILCDGATLAVTNSTPNGLAIHAIDNFAIYGQSDGTGTLVATGSGYGISADGVTINGGAVNATGSSYHGISVGGFSSSVTVNGGSVTATGGDYGIYVGDGSVTVNGGSVTATGGDYGIYALAIVLGWSDPDDSIYASSYSFNGTVSVKAGQFLTDGTAVYRDAVDPVAIADKTLLPYSTPWKSLQARLNAGGWVTLPEDATAEEDDATLVVTNAVTLDLNGHTIDADGRFCVIQVLEGGDLTLTNSVEESGAIVNGHDRYDGNVYVSGGGVHVDGGAFTMAGGTICSNAVNLSTGQGGGVYVTRGTFTMSGGSIFTNSAHRGGGVYVDGGTFEMSGGSIANNTASSGGGVFATDGAFAISGGLIANNHAANGGGGVYVDGNASRSTFTMTGGEISGNVVSNMSTANIISGGGVCVYGNSGAFAMTGGTILSNSVQGTVKPYGGGVYVEKVRQATMTGGTISGNFVTSTSIGDDADGAVGGGVCVRNCSFTMDGGEISGNRSLKNGGGVAMLGSTRHLFTMTGGTISGNEASCIGGNRIRGGGGVFMNGGTFAMTNGAISGNVADCTGESGYGGGGVYMNSGTFEMADSAVSGNAAGNGGGVYVNNGTFKVSGVSVVSGNTNAVGAANNVYLPSGKTIAVDGLSAGAFLGVTTADAPTADTPVAFATGTAAGDERYFTSDDPAFDVDAENGQLRLVKALPPWQKLQARLNAGGTVVLAGDVTATAGDVSLVVTNAVTLDLNGHTLAFNGSKEVFAVVAGGDLTITNRVEGAGAVTGGGDHGVHVGSNAVFRLQGGAIAGNESYYAGGGVFVNSFGTFEMSGGSITNNAVRAGTCSGGGVYVVGDGTFTMTGGEISGNTARYDGGGVYVDADAVFTMTGGEISGNTASSSGGGVFVDDDGTFTMSGGAISGNAAEWDGGGVYVYAQGTFTMTGGTISGNAAYEYGGGVYVDDGTFTVSGSPVVSGSTNSVGAAANVYLSSGKKIAVNGLSSGASIGVTAEDAQTAASPVAFATGATAGDDTHFTSDNPAFAVEAADGGILRLVKVATPWDLLQAQLNAGGTVTLSSSVTATANDAALVVTNAVTLDLNGHALVFNGSKEVFHVGAGGDLALTNRVEGAGAVTGGGDHGVYVGSNAVFRLRGGAIAGNVTDYAGGGVFVDRFGTFEMSGGSITNNAVRTGDYFGGGVYVAGDGTFTMSGGEISGNTADYYGGGVYVDEDAAFTMTGGEISGNTANYGGGVYVNGGAFTMTGGEISGNTANWYGGGVYVQGTFTMTDGTISGNTAERDGGGVFGAFAVSGSSVVFGNTNFVGAANNVYLPGGTTIAVNGLSAGASIGVTTYSAPTESEPVAFATDAAAGNDTHFTSDNPAFAVEAADGGILRLVKVATPWDLLQAQLDAGGTVTLSSRVTATANDATLTVTNAVTLDLNGHTIDADGRFGVIQVLEGGDLTLTNGVPESGAVTGGRATEGGGVCVDGGAFTMAGGDISGNTAEHYGGGVFVYGAFTMTGGTISGNTGSHGGGVYVASGTFTMNGGTIFGNTANVNGGGVYVYETFTMNGGTIFGNGADGGGGVWAGGMFEMHDGAITGNQARYGGGVNLVSFGTFAMVGGTISGNVAAVNGGGVYASPDRQLIVLGSPVVSGNTNSVGTANNVYLKSGDRISVNGLSSDASIGVTTADTPAEFSPVAFATGATAGDEAHFFSDDPSCRIGFENDTLWLFRGTAYPAYLAGAEECITNNWLAWAGRHGAVTNDEYEAAFLLDVAPAALATCTGALLRVSAFAPAEAGVRLELACDIPGYRFFQPEGGDVTVLGNGYVGLEVARDLASLAGETRPIPVPATVDAATGRAVLDLDFGLYLQALGAPPGYTPPLPASLFARPVLTPVRPDPEVFFLVVAEP